MKRLPILILFLLCAVATFAQNGAYTSPAPGSSSSSSSASSGIPQNGIVFDYRFTEGSGTSVTDFTGNGNTGTFCASAPTWLTPVGIHFNFSGTQCFKGPAFSKNLQTIMVLVNFQGTNNTFNQNAILFGGDGGGSTGHSTGIVAVESDGSNQTGIFQLDEIGGSAGNVANIYFGYLNGKVAETLVLSDSGQDIIYENSSALGLVSGNFTGKGVTTVGNWSFGFASGILTAPAATGYQGDMFRAIGWNRVLTQTEIAQAVAAINYFIPQQSNVPNLQCCSSFSNDTNSFAGLEGDSIANGVGFKALVLAGPETWVQSDMGIGGSTQSGCLTSGAFCGCPYYRPFAAKNVIETFGAGNDIINGSTPLQAFQTVGGVVRQFKSCGFRVGVATLVSRSTGGFDANRDTFNQEVRNQWSQTGADFLIDVSADPNVGADGAGANATFFPDGVHPSSGALSNDFNPYFQRAINRFYGCHDWTCAVTYGSVATAATAPTACSESTNTVTVTSTLNPPVGSTVLWTGATPAAYNSSAAGWWVLTTSGSQFTFLHPTSGLGVCTVQGLVSVAQQKDTDGFYVVNFGAGSTTLQSAIGYGPYLDGQPAVCIRNINAAGSTITPWGAETIDGAATKTIAAATTVCMDPVFAGTGTAGANWKTRNP